MDRGGLGIGSLASLNLALLQKWRWHFYNKKEALWCRVIKAIQGEDGGISNREDQRIKKGTWCRIIGYVNYLHDKQIIDYNTLKYRLVSGDKIRLWLDTWIEEQPFCVRFNRLFRLELNPNCKVCERWGDEGWIWNWRRVVRGGIEQEQLKNMLSILMDIQVQDGNDQICWFLDGQTEFTVAGIRRHIDAILHTGRDMCALWCNSVPKKINVFAWRVMLDRLPTKYNISRIGLEIESILCFTCGVGMETMSHVLFACSLAKEVWIQIFKWCNLSMFSDESLSDWREWCEPISTRNNRRLKMHVIGLATCWMIWRYRNSLLFDAGRMRKRDLVDNIILLSFSWLTHRNKKYKVSWVDWLKYPL